MPQGGPPQGSEMGGPNSDVKLFFQMLRFLLYLPVTPNPQKTETINKMKRDKMRKNKRSWMNMNGQYIYSIQVSIIIILLNVNFISSYVSFFYPSDFPVRFSRSPP